MNTNNNKLAICSLGFFLVSAYALAHPTVGEQSYLMAENHNAPHIGSKKTTTDRIKTIDRGRYIGGGVASLLLGFGIGHAIQGRWSERGWVFTLGEAISWVGLSTTGFYAVKNYFYDNVPTGYVISISSFALLVIGFRIWSVIDTFELPSHIKIAQESRLQISPLVVSNSSNLHKVSLGLGIKYRF